MFQKNGECLHFHGLLELLVNGQNCERKSANAKHRLFFGVSNTSSPFTLCWEAGEYCGLGKEGNARDSGLLPFITKQSLPQGFFEPQDHGYLSTFRKGLLCFAEAPQRALEIS